MWQQCDNIVTTLPGLMIDFMQLFNHSGNGYFCVYTEFDVSNMYVWSVDVEDHP